MAVPPAGRNEYVKLLAELRRRHVFKVSVAYIVVAWVILQVTDVFADNLDLPVWAFRLVFFLLIVGFPLIVMFAWAYDLTPEGIRRTAPVEPAKTGESAQAGPAETAARAQPVKASVAVLPFVNMSDDRENEYFSDGLSEELLNVLAKVSALKVAARTSSFFFKGHTGDVADVARRLGVASILEGSVRRSGSRVRITAQLINATDGYHLWSETYDRELDDILAVQDDIAASVADALKVKLLDREQGLQKAGGAGNTRAFQAYLLGSHYRMRGSSDEASLRKALDAFNEAIEFDPAYAQAYAGLAATWDQLATNSFIKFQEGTDKATAAALKAIELAPELSDGHVVLGRLLFHYKLDQFGARKALTTAMKLNPGNAEAQIEYARITCYFGDVEASVAAAGKALELDPLSLFAHYFLGHVLYFGRRYDEAISVLRGALNLDPQFPRPRYTLAMCLYMKGDIEAALTEVEAEPLTWMRNSGSAIVLHRLGRIAEAEASLHRLVKDDDEEYAIYQQGQIRAQWGQAEAAIDALNRARALHDPGVSQILVDPLLDPIRGYAGFEKLVKEMGFSVTAGSPAGG